MPELKYVWCLNNNSIELSEYKDVIIVKRETFLWFYHILTAKVIITNRYLRGFLPYRKNQIIINTWHGGGAYKIVGVSNNSDISNRYWSKKTLKNIFPFANKNTRYFISSCEVFSHVMVNSYCVSKEKFLSIGMPRNDIFFVNNNDIIISLKIKLGIPLDHGIVLYSPTYRGYDRLSEYNSVMALDIINLKNALKERFKNEFVCLYRYHYLFQKKIQLDDTINVSSYNDMQELLLISDVLITDYSSSIWDFSLTLKPCFLFAPDLDLYLSHDRGFYTPIEQWPFPLAKTNEELCKNIANFNQEEYYARVKKHHEVLGSYEQGTATSQMTKLLQKIFE